MYILHTEEVKWLSGYFLTVLLLRKMYKNQNKSKGQREVPRVLSCSHVPLMDPPPSFILHRAPLAIATLVFFVVFFFLFFPRAAAGFGGRQ